MMFVTISPKQAAQYSYMCVRLKNMVNKMGTARKTLEGIANTSFDKSLAKCVYLLASESLQCENEIRAHINSLSCSNYDDAPAENKKLPSVTSAAALESICDYSEEIYLNSYKKLLNDKHLGKSIKSLIQNHLKLFISSITQLRLFNEVQTAVN
ncbi:MAG TPA: hypothetical protein VGI61_04260 [Parafilimonas sp.]